MKRFADRREVGRELAAKLRQYRGKSVVFALPRGGVEVAVEVARVLDAPLDLLIARKIGHPMDPEFAIAAVSETGPLISNVLEKANVDPLWLEQAEQAERVEAKRRREAYLADHEPLHAKNKVAVVVDDGIATGLTMWAAVMELHARHPKKIVVAVPCAPRDAVEELLRYTDEVVVLTDPDTYRGAVGAYYDWFPQLEDHEVIDLLQEAEEAR